MTHRLKPLEERLLRSHIRLLLREGEIPRSNPVSITASSNYSRIGLPGKALAKTVGTLLVLNWASKYLSSDCLSSVRSYGMPLPLASASILAFKGKMGVNTAGAALGAQELTSLKQAAGNWQDEIKKDIQGDGSSSENYHGEARGLKGLFDYIAMNIDAGGPNSIWPTNGAAVATALIGGEASWMGSGVDPTSQYGYVAQFVYKLLNYQCEGSINNDNVKKLLANELSTRKSFIDFVNTYAKTCFEDYENIVKDHLDTLKTANITPNPATVSILNSVAPAYRAASVKIK